MDFNYYYRRHQISLMRADAASTASVRAAHHAKADAYRHLINLERQKRSATAAF